MNHVTIALEPGQVDVASQKRTYTVLEIQDILSISRPTAYALIRKNYFRSIRVGGQIRVSKKSFDEWLNRGNGGDAQHYPFLKEENKHFRPGDAPDIRLEQSGILLAGTSEPVSHDSGCWPDADNAGQL